MTLLYFLKVPFVLADAIPARISAGIMKNRYIGSKNINIINSFQRGLFPHHPFHRRPIAGNVQKP
jgi:hypothetical protein